VGTSRAAEGALAHVQRAMDGPGTTALDVDLVTLAGELLEGSLLDLLDNIVAAVEGARHGGVDVIAVEGMSVSGDRARLVGVTATSGDALQVKLGLERGLLCQHLLESGRRHGEIRWCWGQVGCSLQSALYLSPPPGMRLDPDDRHYSHLFRHYRHHCHPQRSIKVPARSPKEQRA
jgi:hypothetical protein